MFNLPSAAISLLCFVFLLIRRKPRASCYTAKIDCFRNLQDNYTEHSGVWLWEREQLAFWKQLHFVSHPPALRRNVHVPTMFKAWRVRATEAFQHNRCSLSLHDPPWCASRLQDTTLNTPQRNLQGACVLMNKDVRADSAVTGNEQLTE